MKKNKIIPFSLLFITLSFLELFCILKYAHIFYFPLAVGATMLGSAYLLLTEIQSVFKSFIKERDEAREAEAYNPLSNEKEEAAKLAKATYVLEKRILNLLEERLLMPEENMENLSSLQGELVRAIKASIKYDRENTKHLSEVISNSAEPSDNYMEATDLNQILAKFDALALELKGSQLTMGTVKEQLQTIIDIARQIANNRVQYNSVINEPVIESPNLTAPITEAPLKEEVVPETVIDNNTLDSEEMPEFVDTLSALDAEPESEPTPAPVTDDPNKKMSPDDIAALFASANLELEPEPSATAPKTAIEALSKPASEPTPVSDDPNKKMSPDDIAALFASAGR